jgi:uracil-DNA glycosylase
MKINNWESFFASEFQTPYAKAMIENLAQMDGQKTIYPPKNLRFRAFELCPLDQVKVIMIGQDPYHQPGQANGLAFSVNPGVKLPPSLVNIYKEIITDCQVTMNRESGDLSYLASQGVLLLNAALTVERDHPLSHAKIGYQILFRNILSLLNAQAKPYVYLLWGGQAKQYAKWLTQPNQLVLTANHPSPLSANRGGWFGSRHFSKTNQWLIDHHLTPVKWSNT